MKTTGQPVIMFLPSLNKASSSSSYIISYHVGPVKLSRAHCSILSYPKRTISWCIALYWPDSELLWQNQL